MSGVGPLSWLLSFGGQVCVCDEHLPDSEPSEVEHTVPGAVCRPATLAEVRLPKMDRILRLLCGWLYGNI